MSHKSKLHTYKATTLTIKEWADRLDIPENGLRRELRDGRTIAEIAEGRKINLTISTDREALGSCTDFQLEILSNPNGSITFGLNSFFELAKVLENSYLPFQLSKPSKTGFVLKYYLSLKEFSYLREELSIELDTCFMRENQTLMFSIGSINFEVEKVSLKIAKKMQALSKEAS